MTTKHQISLVIGLGNPGRKYENTRHNAGAWLVRQLSVKYQQTLRVENKFFGLVGNINVAERKCYLLLPTTFMNNSGQAVFTMAKFYKISPENILVVHDELDLPVGVARLKFGQRHRGHNGLRDILQYFGNKGFYRLRIGIGRPEHNNDVTDYVVKPPSESERGLIDDVIARSLVIMPDIIAGEMPRAMQTLHTRQKTNTNNNE